MTALRTVPLPDDPTPEGIAAADQNHAAVRAVLDALVSSARKRIISPGFDPDDVGVWATVAMPGVIDAAFDLAGDDLEGSELDQNLTAYLVGMAAEAVLRLAAAPAQ